jgi:MFS family permease
MPLDAVSARFGDIRDVFAIRDFRVYQIGNALSTLGFWMQRVAIGWITWQMTGSEAWLGAIAFAELFPSLLTGLAGGVLADRWPRVRVMLWGQAGVAAVSGAFWLLYGTGALTPIGIAVLMVALGALSGLILPARLAMASVLVPGPKLSAALAVNSTSFNLARFVGPALAGVWLAFAGASGIFALAMASYVAFVLCLARIAPAVRPPRPPVSNMNVFRGLAAATLVVAVMGVQLVQGLALRPASEVFPAFADEVFGLGALGLGLLNAALGIGAMVGALAFGAGSSHRSALRHVFGGSVIFALSLAVFAVAGPFWLALLVLAVQGAAMSSSNIAALTFVQQQTPDDQLGRVLSFYALVFRAAPALGALCFGVSAELLGLRTVTLAAAALGGAATLGLLVLSLRSGARDV